MALTSLTWDPHPAHGLKPPLSTAVGTALYSAPAPGRIPHIYTVAGLQPSLWPRFLGGLGAILEPCHQTWLWSHLLTGLSGWTLDLVHHFAMSEASSACCIQALHASTAWPQLPACLPGGSSPAPAAPWWWPQVLGCWVTAGWSLSLAPCGALFLFVWYYLTVKDISQVPTAVWCLWPAILEK